MYIRREDAIEALCEICKALRKSDDEASKNCPVIRAIPSADVVERKRGEWIPCTKHGLPLSEMMRIEGKQWYGYKCSQCNFIYRGCALTQSPFCQMCGADMRERKDNE